MVSTDAHRWAPRDAMPRCPIVRSRPSTATPAAFPLRTAGTKQTTDFANCTDFLRFFLCVSVPLRASAFLPWHHRPPMTPICTDEGMLGCPVVPSRLMQRLNDHTTTRQNDGTTDFANCTDWLVGARRCLARCHPPIGTKGCNTRMPSARMPGRTKPS